MPTVSCIIIFLNEERFLQEAIQSVISQTYSDWELLLIDDGSKDLSGAIAQNYCSQYPAQIRYCSHPGKLNRGMSASRNLGLQQACGRYVAFLDGDDVWVEQKLAEQVAAFELYPDAVVVCGATEHWFSWTGRDEDRRDRVQPVGAATDALVRPPALMRALYPLGKGASPSTSNFMVDRTFALEMGGFDEAFPGMYEDQTFKIKFYLRGTVYISGACWDRYRQHEESCVYRDHAEGRHRASKDRFLRWLESYLRQSQCKDPEINQMLRRALRPHRYPRTSRVVGTIKRMLVSET